VREPLRIFIGFDPKEVVAWHVLAHSILRRATVPVAITPLVQASLRSEGLYTRERGPTESTEFSMTRFLVPYLSGYHGTSIFMDCDMLCRTDIADIFAEIHRAEVDAARRQHPAPAVLCCQHSYTPSAGVKFLGNVQTIYPKKNWSSFMVFRNDRCRALTPDYVNTATGLDLHRFMWVAEEAVANLPFTWNHLVGEYEPNPDAKVVHWTLGGPYFSEYTEAEFAAEWFAERDRMLTAGVPVTQAA